MLGDTPKRRGEGRQMERGREGETGRNANEWSASGGLKRHPKQRQRERWMHGRDRTMLYMQRC